jgi:hypothetical protein
MKNPFKAFAVFLVIILSILFLGSCTSSHHGYNYKAHRKKSEKLVKKVVKLNRGRELTKFRAPCRRK